jgi:hypothetical protein
MQGDSAVGDEQEELEEQRDTVNDFVAQRERDPLNEFLENRRYFLGGFVYLFPFGKDLPADGSVPLKFVQHLLQQADKRFTQNTDLLFALFNQFQRHAAARAVAVRVRTHNAGTERFVELVHEPGFRQRLERAIANPNEADSLRLVKELSHLTSLHGAPIPWSPFARHASISQFYAMVHYFGLPSFFVTIAPADVDSVLMLRLAGVRSGAVEHEIPVPISSKRHKILAKNPVAAGRVYVHLVEAFFEHLVGLPAVHKMRKNHPSVGSRPSGIFGVPIAFGAVSETQGRGSGHPHGLLWNDLEPHLLEQYLNDREVCGRLMERLDSILCTHLADEVFTRSKEDVTTRIREHGELTVPLPHDDPVGFKRRWENCALLFQCHTHGWTCRKGAVGQKRCRLNMPQPLRQYPTWPVEVVQCTNAAGAPELRALSCLSPAPAPSPDPFLRTDTRAILVEHYRPEAGRTAPLPLPPDEQPPSTLLYFPLTGPSSNVVGFNRALIAAAACNNAIVFLGSIASAKSALMYIVKYTAKDGASLTNVLVLYVSAHDHILRHPSVAADTGTEVRTAQHWLTRVLNSISGHVEYSAQMAAIALMGLPSEVWSHNFWYCFIRPAVVYTKAVHEKHPPQPVMEEVGVAPNVFPHNAPVLDEDAFSDDEEHVAPVLPPDGDGQEEIARQPDGNVAVCAQHLHYCFRGEAFVGYSFYEYVGIVSIVPRKESSRAATGGAGRPGNARFDFDPRHPWHATHIQVLRSKHCVPILAGRPVCPPGAPPNPVTPAWMAKADDFAAYMITLFHPWDLATGAPSIPMTYTALLQWMQHLQRDNSVCVHRWIVQVATSLRVNSTVRQWITQYRSRAAKVWGARDERGHDEQLEHDPEDAERAAAAGLDDFDADAILGFLNGVLQSNDTETACKEANSHRLDVVQRLWEQSLPLAPAGPVASSPAADVLRTESSCALNRIYKLFNDIRKGVTDLFEQQQQQRPPQRPRFAAGQRQRQGGASRPPSASRRRSAPVGPCA